MQMCRTAPFCGSTQQALQAECGLSGTTDIPEYPPRNRSGKLLTCNLPRLQSSSVLCRIQHLMDLLCVYFNSQTILQGPVAHIWISEVSLGHSRSATKVARAAMSWHFRIPFTIRDLTLELRNSPAISKRKPNLASKSKHGSKLLLNSGLRLLLGVLPNIPIRIKQLTVKHKVLII